MWFHGCQFLVRLLLRILQFWSGFPFSRSWWAIASGVMFGELIGFLSSPFVFERACHPFLLLCVSSHFSFQVSLMWSFTLVPASIVSSLKGSASYSNVSGAHQILGLGLICSWFGSSVRCICGHTHELGQ